MSDTPRTDAHILSNVAAINNAIVCHDFARQLERELNAVNQSYQTVKDWAHRVSAQLETLLDRCCDMADGTEDATPLEKFCNEMIGISNEISLKDIQTLRAERDQLRAELEKWKAMAKELVGGLVEIEEYWSGNENEKSMQDACKHNVELASKLIICFIELEKSI